MNIAENIQELIKKIDGYADVRFEQIESLTLILKNGISELVNPVINIGGSVRVLLPKHGWGFAVFNKLEDVELSIEDAVSASRSITPDELISLAEVEPVVTEIHDELADGFGSHSLQDKYDILREYDAMLVGYDKRIIERRLRYNEEHQESHFINTEGTKIVRTRNDGAVRCIVIARKDDIVQTAFKSYATRHFFKELTQKHDMVKKVADIALGLVESDTVAAGVYTVVLDHALAGVFIHEAFGHLSEADHIDENPQAQKMMQLGRKFGQEFLNVIDDGRILPPIRGTILHDDEGVPAQKTYLIKEGSLVGRLHSRQTAAKLKEKPTGNARAENYAFMPIVRMTNTAIEAGSHPAKQIFDGIKLGVYALDAYGGQTELENFSFSAGHAFMIRDGKIAEMVRDVVLQGNLFETLKNIEQVGDDFKWDDSGGYCGKGGQRAATSEGSPHIRIRDIVIAGK